MDEIHITEEDVDLLNSNSLLNSDQLLNSNSLLNSDQLLNSNPLLNSDQLLNSNPLQNNNSLPETIDNFNRESLEADTEVDFTISFLPFIFYHNSENVEFLENSNKIILPKRILYQLSQ